MSTIRKQLQRLYASKQSNIVRQLSDRVIAFHPAYARLNKGPEDSDGKLGVLAALLLSQAAYHSRQSPDEWFTLSQEDWQAETCLTRDQQETARRLLVKAGYLHEKKEGLPYRLYFRVDFDEIAISLAEPEELRDDNPKLPGLVCDNPPNWDATFPRTNKDAPATQLRKNQEGDKKESADAELSLSLCEDQPKDAANYLADIFELTWSTYPKKTAKKDGQKAWNKLRPSARIIEAIQAYIAAASKTEKWLNGFVPEFARMLNGELWTDDVSSYDSRPSANGYGHAPPPPKYAMASEDGYLPGHAPPMSFKKQGNAT